MNFNFPQKKGTGIEKMLPHASSECVELIYSMCKYDPDERLSAKQGLRHSYFRDLRYGNIFYISTNQCMLIFHQRVLKLVLEKIKSVAGLSRQTTQFWISAILRSTIPVTFGFLFYAMFFMTNH